MKTENSSKRKLRVNIKRLTLTTAYQSYKSPIGVLHILASSSVVTAVLWDHEIHNYEEFTSHLPNNITKKTKNELASYFQGKLKKFSVPVLKSGTSFQNECDLYLKNIPYGETRSYLQQAKHVRSPNHARAVAGSNASNPISIIIPCHRIISDDGSLGGYAGTLSTKSTILEFEKKHQ